VTFSVVDRGPGIADDVAARLFTPFFTTRSEGMGLGLSLCRTVIEQHGGALDFIHLSRIGTGRGTEFRFTLPAEARERAAAVAPQAADAADPAAELPQ
jgi:two-component system sensor histidine kinase DctS